MLFLIHSISVYVRLSMQRPENNLQGVYTLGYLEDSWVVIQSPPLVWLKCARMTDVRLIWIFTFSDLVARVHSVRSCALSLALKAS